MFVSLPEYREFDEADRNNNTVTKKYTGCATLNAGGWTVYARERRDGKGGKATAMLGSGCRCILKDFEGDSWLDAYAKAANHVYEFIDRSKKVVSKT